jgi:hypothetical protein
MERLGVDDEDVVARARLAPARELRAQGEGDVAASVLVGAA